MCLLIFYRFVRPHVLGVLQLNVVIQMPAGCVPLKRYLYNFFLIFMKKSERLRLMGYLVHSHPNSLTLGQKRDPCNTPDRQIILQVLYSYLL